MAFHHKGMYGMNHSNDNNIQRCVEAEASSSDLRQEEFDFLKLRKVIPEKFHFKFKISENIFI